MCINTSGYISLWQLSLSLYSKITTEMEGLQPALTWFYQLALLLTRSCLLSIQLTIAFEWSKSVAFLTYILVGAPPGQISSSTSRYRLRVEPIATDVDFTVSKQKPRIEKPETTIKLFFKPSYQFDSLEECILRTASEPNSSSCKSSSVKKRGRSFRQRHFAHFPSSK